MKRKLFLFLALLTCTLGFAQERVIKMPEEGRRHLNIAEADYGYWCAIEAGGGSTLMENKKNVALVGASFVNGFRLGQYLKVGVGIGVLYYPNNSNVRDTDNHLSMPLFVNVRGNILSDEIRRTVPYWSVNAGTSIPDGPFLTPTIGLRIGEKRSAFLVGISYTLRRLKSYEGNCHNYSGAMAKIGYEF